ncbi:MAG: TetR/AcrR family transcriptional regulator [Polyangiales bacterium]
MARPQNHKKRHDLAQRAVLVLQREGLDLSMSRLAAALEIKRPTLLYHFATRAEIVETALEQSLIEQATYVIGEVEKFAHPIDRMYAQLRAVHAFHDGQDERLAFLTQAIAVSGKERLDELIRIGNRVFDARRNETAARLREGMKRGVVGPCDPDVLIAAMRALSDGLVIQRVMTGLTLAPVHSLVWEQLLKPLKLGEWN